MTEQELISKIKRLKQIKPSDTWVVFNKNQILGQEPSIRNLFSGIFNWKTITAGAVTLAILLGVFVWAQNALPGDYLYPLKKLSEKSQVIFASKSEKSKFNLELANKRLEELSKIAQSNQVKNLAPAINEFQANVSEAAKNLTRITATTSDPVAMRKIVEATKKLEENKQKVEELGVVIGGTEELNKAMAGLVAREIKDLETRTLSETQQEILAQVKDDYDKENYTQALEKILWLSYPQL